MLSGRWRCRVFFVVSRLSSKRLNCKFPSAKYARQNPCFVLARNCTHDEWCWVMLLLMNRCDFVLVLKLGGIAEYFLLFLPFFFCWFSSFSSSLGPLVCVHYKTLHSCGLYKPLAYNLRYNINFQWYYSFYGLISFWDFYVRFTRFLIYGENAKFVSLNHQSKCVSSHLIVLVEIKCFAGNDIWR